MQFLDQLIAASLAKRCGTGGAGASSPPVICCGDFNAPDGSAEVSWMCGAGDYIDTAAAGNAVSPHPRFLTWDSALNSNTKSDPDEPDARLDYVFARPSLDIDVGSVRRVFDGAETPIVSDHFGVLSTVVIRPKNSPATATRSRSRNGSRSKQK